MVEPSVSSVYIFRGRPQFTLFFSAYAMRAWITSECAHPSKATEPLPAKSEVVVEVFTTGLNFFDLLALPLLASNKIAYDEGAGLTGFFITWPTSYEALVGCEWVLVTAAAGGVGTAAVQRLAKALGAKDIAAASSKAGLGIATHYGGADYSINNIWPDWQQEVLRLTGGKGADVI
ncbi:uncharacterized protein FIBRA_03207 [Fibroporia radiculosa]|uniref:Alcohol dehydrogenase-like C-terminal domain-containing protein n=1 Tax=Fibroporia radiculosa TaxID=599839 RepID=J4H2A0_9APHY|nr:uncharacterized protein FIBRA_03207 [Fibroporia radiculosa]CCM01159.1 predicted protein [Fibroporia radiculosa]